MVDSVCGRLGDGEVTIRDGFTATVLDSSQGMDLRFCYAWLSGF